MKKQMLRRAKTKILLCDSTKTEQVFFSKICSLQEVDCVIVDDGVDERYRARMQAAGVQVVCAE